MPCTSINAFKNNSFYNIPLKYYDYLHFIFTLRLREVKQSAQGHTGSSGRVSLVLESMFLAILHRLRILVSEDMTRVRKKISVYLQYEGNLKLRF